MEGVGTAWDADSLLSMFTFGRYDATMLLLLEEHARDTQTPSLSDPGIKNGLQCELEDCHIFICSSNNQSKGIYNFVFKTVWSDFL